VELAAVVVVPRNENLAGQRGLRPFASTSGLDTQTIYSSGMTILGNDLLRSWMEPIRKTGVGSVWLGSYGGPKGEAPDLTHFAREGVERVLMIRLNSYAEMDLLDFLRFHRESRNSITDATDARGHLGVSLLDRAALDRAAMALTRECDPIVPPVCGRMPYEFRGYAKRILAAQDRQELVKDALLGACAMRPLGTNIRDQVWVGRGASLADTVRILGPAYVGAGTVVRAGATIGPFTSLENDCLVDCGTTVEESTVLPHTYLAPGLLIRRAQVDGAILQDLRSGVVTDLTPAALGRRIPSSALPGTTCIKSDASASSQRRENAASGSSRFDSSSKSRPWVQVQL
jgi:carbonic anhydrase/acetyltransferase-like protein (isoleucine patch superfamily)